MSLKVSNSQTKFQFKNSVRVNNGLVKERCQVQRGYSKQTKFQRLQQSKERKFQANVQFVQPGVFMDKLPIEAVKEFMTNRQEILLKYTLSILSQALLYLFIFFLSNYVIGKLQKQYKIREQEDMIKNSFIDIFNEEVLKKHLLSTIKIFLPSWLLGIFLYSICASLTGIQRQIYEAAVAVGSQVTGPMIDFSKVQYYAGKLVQCSFLLFSAFLVTRTKDEGVRVVVERNIQKDLVQEQGLNEPTAFEHMTQKNGKSSQEYEYNPEKLTRLESFFQALTPVSGIISYILNILGVVWCMQILGLDLKPLLAVGGIGGVIVGLASQSLLSNIISGTQIMASLSFQEGERITLKNNFNGDSIVQGTVEKLDVLRTLVRLDTGFLSTIPNKTISELIIQNESKVEGGKFSKLGIPRQERFEITIAKDSLKSDQLMSEDFLTTIIIDIENFLLSSTALDQNDDQIAALQGISNGGYTIQVVCNTTRDSGRNIFRFRQQMILELQKIVRNRGAELII